MKFQKSRFLKNTPGIEDTANLVEYDQTRSMKHKTSFNLRNDKRSMV